MKKKVKNIHFLINMGSPKTFISKEVLKLYKLSIVDLDKPLSVTLNKKQILVKVFHEPFADLNLLGTDFLHIYKVQLFVDFNKEYFTINFKTSTKVALTNINIQTFNLATFNPFDCSHHNSFYHLYKLCV